MRTFVLSALVAILTACGGAGDGNGITPPPSKKPDPFVTVRVRDLLDTTTAPGRADWRIFALLSGPYTSQNGIAFQGGLSLQDIRAGHPLRCAGAGADSVGQRLFSLLVIADTTSESTLDAPASAIAVEWYNGNHVLPEGWMAMVFPPTDLWNSQQFADGHGLTQADPIKWGFDWTAGGSTSLYERSDADQTCATFP